MKILIAPLNWGLGHATRCVPVIRRYLAEGHEVVLGGDGDSLLWLHRYFPELRTVELASLQLTYSRRRSQVGAMLRALPRLIRFTWTDQALLGRLLTLEPFDLVISDNRFGLRSPRTRCVYMTHQLWIRLPHFWRWLEPVVARFHASIYNRFDEVWVPDYADEIANLSGILGHPTHLSNKVRYIGPLSRFTFHLSPFTSHLSPVTCHLSPLTYKTLAVLSGLEPQRSILEKQLTERLLAEGQPSLIIQGRVREPFTRIHHDNLDIVPYLEDDELMAAMLGAEKIICRSGYSTIMDLDQLGLLQKAELIPTPGQPEQEYLASLV